MVITLNFGRALRKRHTRATGCLDCLKRESMATRIRATKRLRRWPPARQPISAALVVAKQCPCITGPQNLRTSERRQKSALCSDPAADVCKALASNGTMKAMLSAGVAASQCWYCAGGKITTIRFSSAGL